MGVRLHPTGCSIDQTERLAGVPAGTWARLEAYEERRPLEDGPALAAWYHGLSSNADMNALHGFKLFGFGRILPATQAFIRKIGDEDAGETSDPAYVLSLLSCQITEDRAAEVIRMGVRSVRWC